MSTRKVIEKREIHRLDFRICQVVTILDQILAIESGKGWEISGGLNAELLSDHPHTRGADYPRVMIRPVNWPKESYISCTFFDHPSWEQIGASSMSRVRAFIYASHVPELSEGFDVEFTINGSNQSFDLEQSYGLGAEFFEERATARGHRVEGGRASLSAKATIKRLEDKMGQHKKDGLL